MSNNSIIPNTFNRSNSRVPNSYNRPNSSVSSGSGSNTVNRRGNNNNTSRVQGRGGGPFNVVYGRPRVTPQVPANPNNNANSHFNVAQQRLFRLMQEYNNYLNELYRRYGGGNMIPNANRQAINNRIANYQRRIRLANQSFGNSNPF